MSRRKIKSGTHTRKLRGQKATRNADLHAKRQVFDMVGSVRREAHHASKARGQDENGEYTLVKLMIANGTISPQEYKMQMGRWMIRWGGRKNLQPIEVRARDKDMQGFLQSQIDLGHLVPIPCNRGEIPVARAYDTGKVVAMVITDPEVKAL